MKTKKILILHFPNLNNYGTGMMGLITIQFLADHYGKDNLEVYCDFNNHANIDDISNELRSNIKIIKYSNKVSKFIWGLKNSLIRKIGKLMYILFYFGGKGFDKVIMLGGDDLSEFYSRNDAAFEIFELWKASFRTEVILLGQTIGPFNHPLNRFAAKYLLPRLRVFARDLWCVKYLKEQFGIQVDKMADIALLDLPLQQNRSLEQKVLSKYKLCKNEYITIVISGLQESYCNSNTIYITRFREIIEGICDYPALMNKKICLLAHTFPPYGDETINIVNVYKILPNCIKERIVLITDKILETRARFILGNGLFTLSGRMHAAVSTYQMGKPAISLSYSPKYKGVIGESIGRYDLVIEADNENLWLGNGIVSEVINKIDYLLDNYKNLCLQIHERVENEKNIIIKALESL